MEKAGRFAVFNSDTAEWLRMKNWEVEIPTLFSDTMIFAICMYMSSKVKLYDRFEFFVLKNGLWTDKVLKTRAYKFKNQKIP